MALEGTYDSLAAKEIGLNSLIRLMSDLGVNRIYTKKLAANDNSKNQPYMASQMTDLSFLPTAELVPSETNSQKPSAKGRNIKFHASINLAWIDAEGRSYPAPNAKLIFYPQYPEVRFSGFLLGSNVRAGEWMDPSRRGREAGRWLVFGVTPSGQVYAYLVVPGTRLCNEIPEAGLVRVSEIFFQIDLHGIRGFRSPREELLKKLRDIHQRGWISSRKQNIDGSYSDYEARNGGGYTLESVLGIYPNGVAEPDYLGWEVKQFGVTRFPLLGAGPTTLMTPEPDGGFYRDHGVTDFVMRYGYHDMRGKEGRMNFGGLHYCNRRIERTGLTLGIVGFDAEKFEIMNAEGFIGLFDAADNVAASWSFSKILTHWRTKHSQAVYVPCQKRVSETGIIEYLFGKNVELGTGTSIQMMLKSLHIGVLYYDPGIKVEGLHLTRSRSKARSQFRIKHNSLSSLYRNYDFVDLSKV